MSVRCETCDEKIPRSAPRYVNRFDPRKVKCADCVMRQANAGQDLTVHPDDPRRHVKPN